MIKYSELVDHGPGLSISGNLNGKCFTLSYTQGVDKLPIRSAMNHLISNATDEEIKVHISYLLNYLAISKLLYADFKDHLIALGFTIRVFNSETGKWEKDPAKPISYEFAPINEEVDIAG